MLPIKNILNNIDLLVELKELVPFDYAISRFVYIGSTNEKTQFIDTTCRCNETSFKLNYNIPIIKRIYTVIRLDRKVISDSKEDYIIYIGQCIKCKKVYWISYDPKEV